MRTDEGISSAARMAFRMSPGSYVTADRSTRYSSATRASAIGITPSPIAIDIELVILTLKYGARIGLVESRRGNTKSDVATRER